MAEDERYDLNGHTCAWTIEHYKCAHYRCIPRIDHDTTRMKGCDDSNPCPLRHCPGCGMALGDDLWLEHLKTPEDERYGE